MNYRLSLTQKNIEFRAAMQFFEMIHNSRRNRLVKFDYNNFELQDIFLDYNGRKLLINSLQNNKYYNNIAIHVFLPYEVQIPFFSLKNTKRLNTTFMFFNAFNTYKPYLCTEYNNGILDDYINNAQMSPYIQIFAKNVLRILKLSTNPLIYIEKANKKINNYLFNTSVEISAMILTTERLRSEKSLLISYIEFYKLKYTNKIDDSKERLKTMYDRFNSSLIFASKGGARDIIFTDPLYLYNRFIEMLKFSPVYNIFQKLPKSMQNELYDEFYEGKLDRLKSMSENHPPLYQSKFKIFTKNSERFYYLKRKRILNAWMKYTKNKKKVINN